MSKADVGQIQPADRQHTRSPLDEMLSVPLLIASLPPIISEALGRSSLNVAFASERAANLRRRPYRLDGVTRRAVEPVDFGGPPERVQSLAKFQLPLTPVQVYEAICFPPRCPIGRTRPQRRLSSARPKPDLLLLNYLPSWRCSKRGG
jgi:hypothetical protein